MGAVFDQYFHKDGEVFALLYNEENRASVIYALMEESANGKFNKFDMSADPSNVVPKITYRYKDSSVDSTIENGYYLVILSDGKYTCVSKDEFEKNYLETAPVDTEKDSAIIRAEEFSNWYTALLNMCVNSELTGTEDKLISTAESTANEAEKILRIGTNEEKITNEVSITALGIATGGISDTKEYLTTENIGMKFIATSKACDLSKLAITGKISTPENIAVSVDSPTVIRMTNNNFSASTDIYNCIEVGKNSTPTVVDISNVIAGKLTNNFLSVVAVGDHARIVVRDVEVNKCVNLLCLQNTEAKKIDIVIINCKISSWASESTRAGLIHLYDESADGIESAMVNGRFSRDKVNISITDCYGPNGRFSISTDKYSDHISCGDPTKQVLCYTCSSGTMIPYTGNFNHYPVLRIA